MAPNVWGRGWPPAAEPAGNTGLRPRPWGMRPLFAAEPAAERTQRVVGNGRSSPGDAWATHTLIGAVMARDLNLRLRIERSLKAPLDTPVAFPGSPPPRGATRSTASTSCGTSCSGCRRPATIPVIPGVSCATPVWIMKVAGSSRPAGTCSGSTTRPSSPVRRRAERLPRRVRPRPVPRSLGTTFLSSIETSVVYPARNDRLSGGAGAGRSPAGLRVTGCAARER